MTFHVTYRDRDGNPIEDWPSMDAWGQIPVVGDFVQSRKNPLDVKVVERVYWKMPIHDMDAPVTSRLFPQDVVLVLADPSTEFPTKGDFANIQSFLPHIDEMTIGTLDEDWMLIILKDEQYNTWVIAKYCSKYDRHLYWNPVRTKWSQTPGPVAWKESTMSFESAWTLAYQLLHDCTNK